MKAVSAPLKCTSGLMSYLKSKGLYENSFRMKTDKERSFLPLKDMSGKQASDMLAAFPGARIIETDLAEVSPQQDYKSMLAGAIPERLIPLLPTSFDTVGTIAIIDVKPELLKYEKQIAEAILRPGSSIKTVLKKTGIHAGEFRTQKLKFLAGIKTKVAQYRENNVSLELDVEKVYFSPRLSTERKRIYSLVGSGEEVLVMFSGCGPYPLVISRNTAARQIFGIEKNPVAHRYAAINKEKNRAENVTFIKGDVRAAVPKLLRQRQPKIGLKSNIFPESIRNRLKHDPKIYEFHLLPGDLEHKKADIIRAIRTVNRKNIPVYLHQPHQFLGETPFFDNSSIAHTIQMLASLEEIRKATGAAGYIIHAAMPKAVKQKKEEFISSLGEASRKVKGLLEHAYFENLMFDFFCKKDEINEIIKETGIRNICLDVAHAYNSTGSTEGVLDMIRGIPQAKYFHICDSHMVEAGGNEALPIGEGKIDFDLLGPHLNPGIIEVLNQDETKGEEMAASFHRYIKKDYGAGRFDRILMPLPKGAESFLDLAISAAREGATIHFYDFEHESELMLAEKKVEQGCRKAGVRFDLLRVVKCGQYSPGKYRLCADFRVFH